MGAYISNWPQIKSSFWLVFSGQLLHFDEKFKKSLRDPVLGLHVVFWQIHIYMFAGAIYRFFFFLINIKVKNHVIFFFFVFLLDTVSRVLCCRSTYRCIFYSELVFVATNFVVFGSLIFL